MQIAESASSNFLMQHPTTLAAWLDELARRHPPQIMELGLERPKRAMQRLGIAQPDPQQTRIVTIAGTNGKGSVAMLLARMLTRAGISNGLYLSPHLYDFRERVQINGNVLTAADWVAAFNTIDARCNTHELTFFEWVTLAAFLLLGRRRPKIWVLEIGLGGRLDVVNTLDNQLNLITSIDLDHTDRLGSTLDAIATEKAGVMRRGKPTICASPLAVFKPLAQQAGAQLSQIDKDWRVQQQSDRVHLEAGDWQLQAPLPAGVQAHNMALALLAARTLALPALDAVLQQPDWLAQVQLPARQQLVHWNGIRCMIDVAHNQSGIASLAQRMAQDFAGVPAVAVFACLADKQPPANIAALFPQVHSWLVADLSGARTQSAAQLIKRLQLPGAMSLSDFSAAQLQELVGDGVLLVFGSFLVPPLVRKLLGADS